MPPTTFRVRAGHGQLLEGGAVVGDLVGGGLGDRAPGEAEDGVEIRRAEVDRSDDRAQAERDDLLAQAISGHVSR